jgi:hypothetical protein
MPILAPRSSVFRLGLFAFALALLGACRGPQGDPGPRGPAGLNGNITVRAFTYTVVPGDWARVGTQGQTGYGVQTYLLAPEIDAIVMNQGHVQLYLQWPNSPGTWYAMPYSYSFNGFITHLLYSFQLGRVTVEMYYSDFQTAIPSSNYVFKMVIVDGYIGKNAPDWSNYESVRQRFGLADDSPTRVAQAQPAN